ncbi:MAG: MFS transporter [Betaproteobacteria bacterium]
MNSSSGGRLISDRTLWGAWALAVLGALPFSIQPFFLATAAERFGLKADAMGLLGMAETIGVVIASATASFWLRRFDLPQLVKISLTAILLGYLFSAWVSSASALLIVRLVSGVLGHGLAFVLGTTWLCQSREPDRAIAISVVSQLMVSAALLAMLPVVFEAFGFAPSFALIVAFCLALAPWVLSAHAPALSQDVPPSQSARLSGLLPLLLALVLFQVGLASIWAFIESLASATGYSLIETGQMLGVILPLSIIGALGASLLGHRGNRGLSLSAAALIALAGLVILGVVRIPGAFFVGFLLHQIAWNFGIAYVYGAIAENAADGANTALAPGAQALGTAIAPFFTGWIVSLSSLDSVLWISGTSIVVSVMLVVLRDQPVRD